MSIRDIEDNSFNLARLIMWRENILFLKDSLKGNRRAAFFEEE